MSLTAAQILKSLARVPPGKDGEDRFDRATRVKVTELKRGKVKTNGNIRFLCKTKTPEHVKGRLIVETYVTSVEFKMQGKMAGKYVIVSCGCPDFCFMWEYNLTQKDASMIKYGNGEAPTKPIPIGMCKHLIRTFDQLVTKAQVDSKFVLPVTT
jgi:hypothetical protein